MLDKCVLSVLKSLMRCLLDTAIFFCEPSVLLHILLQVFHCLTCEEKDVFSTYGLISMDTYAQHTTRAQALLQDQSVSPGVLLLAHPLLLSHAS